MAVKETIRIGQLLIDQGLITPEQLEAGLKEQKKNGGLLCTVLVRLNFIKEDKVLNILSQQLSIPYIKLQNKDIDPLIIQRVPAKFASHYKIIPLDFQDGALTVAMANPMDVRILDDIRLLLGIEVKGALSSEGDIDEAIRKYYGVGAETLERMVSDKGGSEELKMDTEKAEDLEAMAEDASIVKFVNQLLAEAIKEKATDIHMEPFANELVVRFRIDGILYNINIPETIKYFQPAIVSRIKIMSHLNIAERRLPQDGRIKIKVGDQELDLRISIIPTVFGETVAIRILSSESFITLENLGFSSEDLKSIESVIQKPHGIIFVTGPTGAGKSTTLYAALSRINTSSVKIITVEDPVEYQMKGINQIQANPKVGLTFATGLRHILRHDPDVIMIGEVRDFETAEIAIRSALTGHLVLSTLHTNDAAGAITRLLDMGVEKFLVSSSIECLIAQRLIRTICQKCKTPVKDKEAILKHIKDVPFDPATVEIYEGKGCDECRFTGYRGRSGIHEVLIVNDAIRELILERVSSQQIKQKAVAQGMRTLRYDGIQKVFQGITTYAEVIRVTQQEE